VLELLLLRGGAAADGDGRELASATLRAMAGGGIHDQLGGGFHRYSVDASWTVPHFEKMLYDNALLARAYLHGFQATGETWMREVCERTLRWALREMRSPEGGFHAALDADSEGVEGRYYVWTLAQLRAALGEDAEAAIAWLGATEAGNFADPHHPEPGLNVLQARGESSSGPQPEQRERIRARLLEARAERTRPGLDDKRLTSWNALMVCTLADAGAALGSDGEGRAYLDAARACAEFLLRTMRDPDDRLLRTYSGGRAHIGAYLEDHAFLLEALLILFEATCEERWFREAVALADTLIERFADPAGGGFFSTAIDEPEPLVVRRKDLEDSPIPAGASSAAMGLLRLAQLTGEERYARHADSVLAPLAEIAPRHPSAFGHLLQVMHWRTVPARPIACPVPQTPAAP
jgi:uncharacterized protein YyaL (SSP411 family)